MTSHPRPLISILAAALLLAACASSPPPPAWQINARDSLQRATDAYLSGDGRVAAQESARARAEVARTGRVDLLARGELMHCAARVASLELDDCPAYRTLAQDAAPPEQAYARYLAGEARPADAALLPTPQQALAADPVDPDGALAAIGDPFSRLVAAGVLLRRGRATAGVIMRAVDTAAEQGWRRPLLAWLQVQQQRARALGANEEAARLQRRIDLVLGGGF